LLFPSVIVDDLYVCGSFWCPDEADAPLLIDADTVLSLPVVFQRFKSIAGRYFQIVKNCRPIQLCELTEGRTLDIYPALHALAIEEGLSVFALEVLYRHGRR